MEMDTYGYHSLLCASHPVNELIWLGLSQSGIDIW